MNSALKFILGLSILGVVACSDSGTGSSEKTSISEEKVSSGTAKNIDDLAKCTRELADNVVYVKSEDESYRCNGRSWKIIEDDDEEMADTKNDKDEDSETSSASKESSSSKSSSSGKRTSFDDSEDEDSDDSCSSSSASSSSNEKESTSSSSDAKSSSSIKSSSSQASSSSANKVQEIADEFADVEECSADNIGTVVYIQSTSKHYECTESGYEEIESPKSSSSMEEAISSSSEEITVSSSSEITVISSSSTTKSSASIQPPYDCEVYKCVSTEYLNQEMLSDGIYGELLDDRDDQVYRTIKIGDQVWMAQNLNYDVNDGEQSWCYGYDDETNESIASTNCGIHGRLYTWAAAVGKTEDDCGYGKSCEFTDDVQGVCPTGWHVPSESEWQVLFETAGTENAGANLKSVDGWYSSSGLDTYGFSALPSGHIPTSGGSNGMTYDAAFWTSTEKSENDVTNVNFRWSASGVLRNDDDKRQGESIRCILNSEPKNPEQTTVYDCTEYKCLSTEYLNQEMLSAGKYGELLDDRDDQVYRTIKIGNQTWMAQNLNFAGEDITSWCYNDEEECPITGRLYNWSTSKTVCPSGWKLPTQEEWNVLYETFEYIEMQAIGFESWPNATNSSGFSAVPSGLRDYNYLYGDYRSYIWSSTESESSGRGYAWFLNPDGENVGTYDNNVPTSYGLSVRCIQELLNKD